MKMFSQRKKTKEKEEDQLVGKIGDKVNILK